MSRIRRAVRTVAVTATAFAISLLGVSTALQVFVVTPTNTIWG